VRSYQYIEDLFRNVLKQSIAIGGRFHVAPKGGLEINSDEVNEVLVDLLARVAGQKYPLVLIMAPRSMGNYTDKLGEWDKYRIVLFFLQTTYYDSANQVRAINVNTRTSTHTILQDWHDMKRAGVNFLKVLKQVMLNNGLNNSVFRLEQENKYFDPVSMVGTDRASGVKLEFNVSLFLGCIVEDYTPEGIAAIALPVEDSHPEHKL
jgi:hypothetical protein